MVRLSLILTVLTWTYFSQILTAAMTPDASVAELEAGRYPIPPHDYRYVDARIANWPATVICGMRVESGAPVAMELVGKEDRDRFIHGKSNGFLVALSARQSGDFRQSVPEKGDYAILLINDTDFASTVRLDAKVQFAREPDVAKYLPPARRLAVISISLGMFLIIVSWSTWRLVGAIRRT